MLVLGVTVGFLAIILVSVILIYLRSNNNDTIKSSKYSRILIYGPMNGGKTTLFYYLLNNIILKDKTHTSMIENIESFKIPNNKNTFEFIDYPGHLSKELSIKKYFKNITGLIFIYDGSQYGSICGDGTTLLYNILRNKLFYNNKPKILILFNKTDNKSDYKSLTVTKNIILKELNKRYNNQDTLTSINDNENNDTNNIVYLNDSDNEPITWESIPYDIQFGESSIINKDINDVYTFINSLS
mmetsp:Transcript_41980/g.51664  ORF Transcript_41980/g.51664 Transcript_41980/m.51664 type:complete len:242 (-) Transcript_41980:935-1660(-)